tara:strand:- start:134 stop:2086 length:1953 start_codon:yes stop_codon:yes gene_type:complete
MCGIVLIISKNDNNVINYLMQSISLIQNRGYDSVGICYKNDNKFNNLIYDKDEYTDNIRNYKIIKFASENTSDSYEILRNFTNNCNIKSSLAMGHTRWATHGSKTDINAHPHISFKKQFILVHNGIINNYNKLKQYLISKGIEFYSETDTEVIVNLLEYFYLYDNECKNNIKLCIEKLNQTLDGTWALIIINVNDNDNVFITRHGSPLVLGYSENLFICTSEVTGFAGLVLNYIVLENNDIFKINKNNYTNINKININNYNIEKVNNEDIIDTCYPYNHWTMKEIMDQPHFINCALNNGGRIIDDKIKLGGIQKLNTILNTDKSNIKHIMLFGCGTSYHACMLAKYYFSNKKIIHIIDACEFDEIDIPYVNNNDKILCIFCSQSGETIDIVKCINICNKYNCLTYGVINVIDSLISRLVNCGTYINAGKEIAVASTKSFTNTLIILSLIGNIFNENNDSIKKINNLRFLSNTIYESLYDTTILKYIDEISDYIVNQNINNIFILGKNKLFPVAKEISLKIKEICYIHAEGYSSSSLKHGPFALLDNTNLTILLIDYNDSENLKNLESTYNEIRSRDTNIIVVSNNINIKDILNINKRNNLYTNLLLLYSLDYYNEIIFTIALQILAYNISIKKNINPDKPRNLAKVVTVE